MPEGREGLPCRGQDRPGVPQVQVVAAARGEARVPGPAQAVKLELIVRPIPVASGTGDEVTYDFVLDPA